MKITKFINLYRMIPNKYDVVGFISHRNPNEEERKVFKESEISSEFGNMECISGVFLGKNHPLYNSVLDMIDDYKVVDK